MCYLICEKCSGYYKLQNYEFHDDFGQCQCGGNLKYTKNLNYEFNDRENELNNIKQNSKLFSSSFFNLVVSFIISISILLLLLYFRLITLIMDYSLLMSIILIMVLVFRFIFNDYNTDNSIIRFIIHRSIILITPLMAIFTTILIYMAINVLK